MKTGVSSRLAEPSRIAIQPRSAFAKAEIAAENQSRAMPTDSLETAACLWEAVLTLRDHPSSDPDAIALALTIRETCNAVGTADLRLTVVGWTSAVEAAWIVVADSYGLCFDWDFVPDWIVDHIDWSDPFHPTIKPEPVRQDPDRAAADEPVAAQSPAWRPSANERN
ncbi:MAG: hypothetical protein AB7D33_07715 [Sphingobium sp.]